MKWYWILLIVVAAILIGWAIYNMASKKKITISKTTVAPPAAGATEVTTETAADGTKLIVASRKVA